MKKDELKKDRDEWKRQAESLEQDLENLNDAYCELKNKYAELVNNLETNGIKDLDNFKYFLYKENLLTPKLYDFINIYMKFLN